MPAPSRSARALRRPALAALVALGCNPIAAASVGDMTPGLGVGTGELECWLTLEFARVPSGVDPRDVRVRFHSLALAEPAEFDWDWIARRDVVARGGGFGSGYVQNAATTPETPPPLGEPLKVKFPLRALRRVETEDTLWLHAELFWGGARRAAAKRTIEHVYDPEETAS